MSKVTIIKRSCITGNAVWVYRGKSEESARKTYYRACKDEVERMRHWPEKASRRMANIERLLSDCLSDLPVNAELTTIQREAVRQLQVIGKKGMRCASEFYEHIQELRTRRNQSADIRRKARERE